MTPMRAHGLFIGVDRYASPLISELSCAARDAQALYALFVDTFGGASSVLLVDEEATRANVIQAFKDRFEAIEEDEFVFISYAGHGSDDFFLITHDANPADLAASSIALDDLVELFARIPSKRVMLVLDCCFSGGTGARVFHHGLPTRDIDSVEAALTRIADEGRVILTACDPKQEAIEDPVEGHGMLTRHLLDALRGPAEIVRDGQVRLYDLLAYVTRRVTEDAASIGHDQRPTSRVKVDGELKLPVFVEGEEYARRFPESTPPPVSGELADLVAHGVPLVAVDSLRTTIPHLNELQITAINRYGVLTGRSLVVSAPTSSGKTLIGELTALKGAINRRRALFLMPLKALVADKYNDFVGRYGTLGLRVRQATGDMADHVPDVLSGRYDICLMTYEKAAGLLLMFPHILRGIGTIVVDEVQMLADASRGAMLEFLLTVLRQRRQQGVRPQIVLLSAAIGNTNGLDGWLGAGLLRSDVRPIPLDEGILRYDGTFRAAKSDGTEKTERLTLPESRKGSAQDVVIPLVRKLVADGESVIVFRSTKSETINVASYLARSLSLPPATNVLSSLPQSDRSSASDTLRVALQSGVAFHNADLAPEERAAIEMAFRAGSGLKVVVATTTLAMGVNTPASTVLIVGLEHPRSEPYSVAEYKNMIGRAGRQGFSDHGKAMVVCKSPLEEDRVWRHYVLGQPEALVSRFLDTDAPTLICRVLATSDKAKTPAMTREQVLGFIESSFGWFQLARRPGVRPLSDAALSQALDRLTTFGLVESVGGGHSLTALGRIAGETGVSAESVIRLAEALRGVSGTELRDAALIAAAQLTTELDDLTFPVHETSTQERERWQGALRKQQVSRQVLAAVLRGDKGTARAKRSAAVLMWVQGKELSAIEASIMKHLPRDTAAGAIRGAAERTRDLLPVVVRVAELVVVGEKTAMASAADRLSVQLELGVPRAMIDLAKALGRLLSRGDYLSFQAAGITSAGDFSRQTDAELGDILGRPSERIADLRDALARAEASLAASTKKTDTMPDVVDDGP